MKKRVKPIIRILLILAVSACVIILSFLAFSKPKVRVSRIEVIPAGIYDQLKNGEPNPQYLKGIRGGISGDPGYSRDQVFWQNDQMPSEDMADYSAARFYFEIENHSLFKCYFEYALVDAYEEPFALLIDSLSGAEGESVEPFEKGELAQRIDLFSADRSEEEIKDVLNSMRFQLPFSNRIYSMSNVYADCKDAEIVFKTER